MKEAIGGISIFQIVIVFVLFFTGIMCLTINHSRAFGVKDEIITIIQNNGDSSNRLSNNTIKEIANHLVEAGYRITGNCPTNFVGYDLNGNSSTNKASFCIRTNDISEYFINDANDKCKDSKCKTTINDNTMVYYDVILFYQLDIPGLNNIMNFKMYGSTKVMFD